MNNEEMRIAIAEALGIQTEGWWCPKCEREVAPAFVTYDETHDARSEGCGSPVESMPIPYYTEDLNYCHEMEESLHGEEWAKYFRWLQRHGNATGVRSTAHQRCEAFLRVKGLWKESTCPHCHKSTCPGAQRADDCPVWESRTHGETEYVPRKEDVPDV